MTGGSVVEMPILRGASSGIAARIAVLAVEPRLKFIDKLGLAPLLPSFTPDVCVGSQAVGCQLFRLQRPDFYIVYICPVKHVRRIL